MRLIDADALMAEWEEPRDWLDREQVLRHYTWFKVVIESQPTVEAVPERKKGRWVRKTDGKLIWWECSECGEFPLKSVFNRQDVLSEYCPHCGASMTEMNNELYDPVPVIYYRQVYEGEPDTAIAPEQKVMEGAEDDA